LLTIKFTSLKTAGTMPIKEKLVSDDSKEQFIVDSIYEAVIDQRLAPGTKLSEAALCDSFGLGRMHIRRSLLVLASREVIELQPNKGAFVACPDGQASPRYL
jgi:DNA-binding GntR family transcriptional regulator